MNDKNICKFVAQKYNRGNMNLALITTVFAPWHIVLLIAAILLMFGGQKIPELMGGIGKGMKEFKKAIKDEDGKPEDAPKEIPRSDNKREPLKE